jgi:hypothetical protein
MLDLSTLPLRQGSMAMADLIDAYMRQYEGRDQTRVSRLDYWRERIGKVALQDLSDDHVHQVLEDMATRPARVYAGKDAAGRRQYVFKKRPTAPATLNRYCAALGAVCSFAIRAEGLGASLPFDRAQAREQRAHSLPERRRGPPAARCVPLIDLAEALCTGAAGADDWRAQGRAARPALG